jgi:2,3-bisphosphoglycerate-dependent phosphoglycerate mutase
VQLYFIRHGQSENNLLWQRTGASVGRSEDPELTPTGQRQAEALAHYLHQTPPVVGVTRPDNQNVSGFGITHLYSSLMVRAVNTGTILSRALGLPLVAWEDTHERGGIYRRDEQTGERIGVAGNNRSYFEEHYPDLALPASLGDAGWWSRPYETAEQALCRAECFLRDLLERHGDTEDRVALVSHGGFYNSLIVSLLALPAQDGYWFSLNNAAITRMDFHPDGVGLVYANRVDFLSRELIT